MYLEFHYKCAIYLPVLTMLKFNLTLTNRLQIQMKLNPFVGLIGKEDTRQSTEGNIIKANQNRSVRKLVFAFREVKDHPIKIS